MQQTQINPFQHVLDDEAYNLLTKCDPKLGVAVLSLAVKKFSESKEFLYFLKPENRTEFEDKVNEDQAISEEQDEQINGNEANISMNSDTSNTSNTSNMNNSNTTDIANNSTASSPAAISVAW